MEKNNPNLWSLHGATKNINFIKSIVYRFFETLEVASLPHSKPALISMLDPKVRLTAPLGFFSGPDSVVDFARQFATSSVSFEVQDINVFPCGVGLFTAQTQIIFHQKNDAGEQESYRLLFEADIQKKGNLDFHFLRISIKNQEKLEADFESNYAINRTKSLVFYCMGLIEFKIGERKHLAEILHDDFEIFPLQSEPIRQLDGLLRWIVEFNNLLQIQSICPVNFKQKNAQSDGFEVEFDLLFECKNDEDKGMNPLSKNQWALSNDINERFARIKRIQVERLEPIFI